jgi:hypothetical protein
MLFLSATLFAQNSVWLEKGKENPLLVAEFKDAKDNVFNYLYVESELSNNITNSTYILASRDQKWWDMHMWIHGEFRSFVGSNFSTDNVFLAGINTEIVGNKYGFVNLQTMYRYDGHSNCQVTLLSDWEYGRFFYSMYADFYGYDKTYLHTENRFFFKVVPHVRIGANLVLTSGEVSEGLDFKPMAVLRVDL